MSDASPAADGSPSAASRLGSRVALATGVQLMRFIAWTLRTVPETQALPLSRRIARPMARPFARTRRERYQLLLGEPSMEALGSLEREHVAYLAWLRVQGARLILDTPATLSQKVTLDGEEHLHAALERGRGVLVVSGHTGCWWHVPVLLSCRAMPPLFFVNPALGGLTRYMSAVAGRFGFPTANVGETAYEEARRRLRANGVVFVTPDVTIRPERSAWLRFGAAELLVDPGAAVMALRQRAPVVWVTTFRDLAGHSHLVCRPPIDVGPGTACNRPQALLERWLDLLWSDLGDRLAQWWAITYAPVRRAAAGPAVPPRP
jgi:KDO2-lipid IV(A) lauroyltransferase